MNLHYNLTVGLTLAGFKTQPVFSTQHKYFDLTKRWQIHK